MNFKNIFDAFPQGILEIIHDVITENFPELILDNFPKAFLDSYPKELFIACPNELLKSEEFKFHFKQKLNTELNLKERMKFIPDIPFEVLEGIIINLEFQSYETSDFRKGTFNIYQAILNRDYGKTTITVVFSTKHSQHELITYKVNPYDGLTMLIISLTSLNLKQTLNNSNYKIRNNINMSNKEKALFLLSPLMDEKGKVETLKETIHLSEMNKNLSPQEYEDMMNIQLNFALEWFSEEDQKEIGGTQMGVVLTEKAQKFLEENAKRQIEKEAEKRGEKRGEKIGEKRGKKKGIQKTAKNMIKQGFSLEDISKATGLSQTQIGQLCSLK